jgi:predicted nucleic acid-binding protein
MQGGVVSLKVLSEFAAVCRRKHGMNWDDISDSLSAIKGLCDPPVSLTLKTHEAAIEIAGHHGFHIYDSLILAAAQQAGCTSVYSEDMQRGRRIGSLQILNPFLGI